MRLGLSSELSLIFKAGAFKSLASLFIKIAAAALTYLSYVVLSRTMTVEQYGHFAFGLSLATVLAIAAGMGQQTAILRIWPEHTVAGQRADAEAALSSGATLTILAALAISLALSLGEFILVLLGRSDGEGNQIYAAAFLVLPLALAEFQSSALRAQGSVWSALAPRDIVWRIALPAAVLLLYAFGVQLSGPDALVASAGLLLAILGFQYLGAMRRGYVLTPRLSGVKRYWGQWGTMSRWLLFGTVIDAAALNFDIIIVGIMGGLESSAVYFNSARTAGLMTLLQFAMTLVIAPMLARHFHAGEMRKAQAVAALCGWAGFLFSVVGFAGFLVFGDQLLMLFGSSYAEGRTVLLLLGVGFLFEAATGPSRTIMLMTGHERAYAILFGIALALGTLGQVLAFPHYGIVGAAAATMATRIASQLAFVWWCRTRIGLDSTLFGLLALRQTVDRPRPVPIQV